MVWINVQCVQPTLPQSHLPLGGVSVHCSTTELMTVREVVLARTQSRQVLKHAQVNYRSEVCMWQHLYLLAGSLICLEIESKVSAFQHLSLYVRE